MDMPRSHEKRTALHRALGLIALGSLALGLGAPSRAACAEAKKRTIVATYSILQSLVRDLVGDAFEVKGAIPNGLDLHQWEPSAREIEALTKADLIVMNGLNLEGGMQRAIAQATRSGTRLFVVADHAAIRKGVPHHGNDHTHGHDHSGEAGDPHLWTDPTEMKTMVHALSMELKTKFGVDLSAREAALEQRLDALDAEIKRAANALPPERRKIVTGHESLGYFADRYGFEVIGAVVPGYSTEAESSAAALAALKELLTRNRVKVVFTEIGTPKRVAETLAREAGVRCVPLVTHALPADGSYFTYMRDLSSAIIANAK